MSPVQAFLVKQANTLTLQSPTLGGFQVNNGQFDVISALEGDKLQPQNGAYNKLIGIFKHMIPGFREAVDMKNKRLEAQRKYEEDQRGRYRVRVPLLEPDNTPLLPVRFEVSNRKPSYQEGGEFGGSNKGNRFISEPYPLQTPEIMVNSKRPYRFDRRELDLGNGRSIISDAIFREYVNGQHLGDASDIIAGRTIYQTPERNDTVYGNTGGFLNGYWIPNDNGFMPIMSPSPNGKANFYKNIKKSFVYPSNSYRNNTKEIQAFNRAKQGN